MTDNVTTSLEYTALLKAFGGDPLAQRMVTCLARESIVSLAALADLYQHLGYQRFRSRLLKVRNIGEVGLQLIEKTVTEYINGVITEPSGALRFMPIWHYTDTEETTRYNARLDQTRTALRGYAKDHVLVPNDKGGMTAGDLEVLLDIALGRPGR